MSGTNLEQDDTVQQQDNTQQQQDTTQQSDAGKTDNRSDNDKRLDGMLSEFMESTDAPAKGGKSAQDQGKGQQQQDKGKDGKGQDDNTQQRGTQQQQDRSTQQTRTIERQFGNLFKSNTNGDILDAQGNLIAKQGYGRSIFHKLYPHIEHYAKENAALTSKMKNFEDANALAKSSGLSLDEQGAGMHLMMQWKKDPAKTIQTMLTLAGERGIDVSSITQGGGGLDMSAYRNTVTEVVTKALEQFLPLVENFQQTRQQQELSDNALTEYNAFMEEFPDAAPHQGAIASLMRDKQLSHREAYYALTAFAATNKLDFTKDLKPQLLARQNKNPSGNGQNRELPDFSGRSGNTGDTVVAGSRGIADPDESYDSIARRVFAKHGVQAP